MPIIEVPAIHETRDGSAMVELAPEGFAGWFVERGNEMSIIEDDPTIRENHQGSTINHTVTVDGEVVGWVVEHRSPSGKTLGWSVWGDQGPDGLFPSRDEAANWIVNP